MIISGLDQSMTGTGITISDNTNYNFYIIKSEKTKGTKCPSIDNTRRLIEISSKIKNIYINSKVEYVALEGLSFGSKGRSVMTLGGLSHMIRMALIELDVPFIVVPPKTLKKYWTGSGNSNKMAMIDEAVSKGINIDITKNYGTKKSPDIKPDDNVVDSLALCSFLDDYLKGNIPDYENKIERSVDL